MKEKGCYCAIMGSYDSKNPALYGLATIIETATTWRISFKPFGFEYPTAVDWVYKKRSKKEDGNTSAILPDFWKEYEMQYNR